MHPPSANVLSGGVSLYLGTFGGSGILGNNATEKDQPKVSMAVEGPRLTQLAMAELTLGDAGGRGVGVGVGRELACEIDKLTVVGETEA